MAARPVILNGIEDIVERPDLADRAVFLTLEPIPEERRRPEGELWTAFEAEPPRIRDFESCPLRTQKRNSTQREQASALCQKRTLGLVLAARGAGLATPP